MKIAPKPANEAERLSALYEYNILDTLPESDYDDITNIAAGICNMPISLITIIDNNRQWFKSKVGIERTETPREFAFCAHAILNPHEMLIVNDTAKDDRFYDNPSVTNDPNVGFYAGVPLVNDKGNALGTLCVIDSKPNDLTEEQKRALKALGRQVVAYFEMRKLNHKLALQKVEMEQLNKDLSLFANAAAHNIKSPCASLAMSAEYLKDAYAEVLDEAGKDMLTLMEETCRSAIDMVDGILRHTKIVNQTEMGKEHFVFSDLINELKKSLPIPPQFSINVINEQTQLYTCRYFLQQIFLNLCTNAIRYNDKERGELTITIEETDTTYTFTVADNGRGINEQDQVKIFELFGALGIRDRNNVLGHGIGLATVKRLVQKMGGDITVSSEIGKGSIFSFTISK